MLAQILLLVAGLILLVKGGELFVTAAVRMAELFRMPRVVIGTTLVSLATTMPELVVSLMAGGKGESGLAVGNAIGSCICNISLILGITATLRQIDVHPRSLTAPILAMFGFGVLLFLLTLDLRLSRWQGIILVAGGFGYFVYDFLRHTRGMPPKGAVDARAVEKVIAGRFPWFHGTAGSVVQFLIGAGIVVVGSRLLVGAAVTLAGSLGIPSILIGLTIVAVGTSLPELITAITSTRTNVSDLAIGNILGANIANLSFIVGVAAIMSDVTMTRPTQVVNFTAMLGIFSLLLWMLLNDRKVSRMEGVVLLVSYSVYLCALVFLAAGLKR